MGFIGSTCTALPRPHTARSCAPMPPPVSVTVMKSTPRLSWPRSSSATRVSVATTCQEGH
jgi:hypothetical protein